MSDWPTTPADIIHEALREYVGDGDGADEKVLADFKAKLRAEIAAEIRDWFYTEEHPGMTRSEAEVYEETYERAATIAEAYIENTTNENKED